MGEGWVVRRKRFVLPFGLGVFAGVALGFAAGLVYLSVYRSSGGEPWEEWKYPGATDSSSSGVGGGRFMGPGSIVRGVIQHTPDSFDDVVRHYSVKLGMTRFNMTGGAGAFARRGAGGGIEQVIYLSDGQPRKVKTQAFATRGMSGSVVVFISRADGEDQTQVFLYSLPRQ